MDLMDHGGDAQGRVVSTVTQAAIRMSITLGKDVNRRTFSAVTALGAAATKKVKESRTTGEVSNKRFAKLARGQAETVTVADRAAIKEFRKELKNNGVSFTVNKLSDGRRTFSVQAKDAKVIETAFARAYEKASKKLQPLDVGRKTPAQYLAAARERLRAQKTAASVPQRTQTMAPPTPDVPARKQR